MNSMTKNSSSICLNLNSSMRLNSNELIEKGEELSEKIVRSSKKVLPTLARFCLVSTYIEDSFRLIRDWDDQRNFFQGKWNIHYFLAIILLLYTIIIQSIASIMILIRFKVDISCMMLLSVLFLQAILYRINVDLSFLSWFLPFMGSLMLLYAESKVEYRKMFAGLPNLEENRPRNILQLLGRIMVVLMFLSLVHFEFSWHQLVQLPIAGCLMILVTIGYKTKLSALLLFIWLNILNVWHNCFWTIDPAYQFSRDGLRIQFFATLSVIGGLLMIVYLGPGGVSLDDYKKSY
ncbi:surfeit locus protein 4 homolog [Brevipalpus obovatus]|uniref:surfeit locus protein 4 homolog n=1 Tax=Brevipalpus obovatus TaxID=246614 RepID=UPI003D9F4EEB